MKKTLASFVVAGTLTIGNISAVASEYIQNTVDVITQIDSKEKIKKDPLQIVNYIKLLEQSDKEFQDKVIPFMLDNYKNINSSVIFDTRDQPCTREPDRRTTAHPHIGADFTP